MQSKETELLTFFDFPIEQFADRSARWLLEDRENVRGLLEIFAEYLAIHLDFSKLNQINRNFIPDNLREQEADLVYSVPFLTGSEAEELLIYILIEHQSSVDTTMAFRILFYMTLIWDFQRREWESNNVPRSQRRFRPIIPIIFYTGEQRWKSPLSLSTLVDLPDVLSEFVPRFGILFFNVKETDTTELTKTDHPFGWLLTVLQKEFGSKEEIRTALVEAVKHIDTLDEEDTQQWKRAIYYLYLLILHRRPPEEHDELRTLVYQHIQDTPRKEEIGKMAQTMAEYLIEQGEKRGEKRGETRAKREVLLKLLRHQFDSVPESLTSKIASTRSLSQLDTLIDRVVTAESLDDIDWEN